MALVSMDFKGKSIADKITKANIIIGKLTDNPNFPNPKPTLEQLTDATKALVKANMDYQDGGKTNKVRLDKAEEDLDKLMSTLAAHLQSESGGDEEIILSAGVGVRADSSPVGTLAAPTNFLAKVSETEGAIDLKWAPVKGSKSYIIQLSSDLAGSSWSIHDVCTTAKLTVTGFESGKKYLFKVIALGAAGKSTPSDPAVGMAG